MKKIIKIFIYSLIIVCIFFVKGCNEEPTQFNYNFVNGIRSLYNFEDTTNISALIIVRGNIIYQNRVVIDSSQYIISYLSDGYDLVNVTSNYVNNISLSPILDCDDCPGQYDGIISYPTEYPPFLIWNVNGYLGRNFSDTFQVVQKMSLLNFIPGDTVSKSTGFVINYTGSDNNLLYVSILSDSWKTSHWISPDSVQNEVGKNFETPDNGSLYLSPTVLAELPTGQY